MKLDLLSRTDSVGISSASILHHQNRVDTNDFQPSICCVHGRLRSASWLSVLTLLALTLLPFLPSAHASVGDTFNDADFLYKVLTENGTTGTVSVKKRSSGVPSGKATISTWIRRGGITYSVTEIAVAAFSECSGLTAVVIPDSVTTIRDYAFQDCNNLTSVVMGGGITTIKVYAFYNCFNLTSVVMGGNINTIGNYAFQNCNNLPSVEIPSSVTTIGDAVFKYCPNLKNIIVDKNNQNYSSLDGILFNKKQTTLIQYPCGRSGEYALPDTVTNIADSAFYNCDSLTSVVIPDSVTAIRYHVFRNCNNLTSVMIGNKVATIGWWAFSECSSLTSVYFKGNAPILGSNAFSDCPAILYYVEGTTGWTNPWGERPTKTWVPISDTPTIEIDSIVSKGGKTFLTLSYTGTLQASSDAKSWQNVSDASGGTYIVDTSLNATRLYRVMK